MQFPKLGRMEPKTPARYPAPEELVSTALSHVVALFGGNGVKKEDIKLLSHSVALHTLNASTHLEVKPVFQERQVPGKVVAGQVLGSRDEAMKSANHVITQTLTNSAAKAKMANVLLDRAEKGFGLRNIVIPVDFVRQEFTWHEPCHTCHGTSRSTCPKCQGRKLETCIRCNGRTLMFCPMCRGTGLLQGNACPRCKGQRYVPCDGCQRSGMMGCRVCTQTGQVKCVTCNGVGYKTNILLLLAEAMPTFSYDPKSIPKNAADAIEMNGSKLAQDGSLKIEGRIADDAEKVLGASYEVTFPCGKMLFDIAGVEIKSQLFGYNAVLTGMPNHLDKLLGQALRNLEEALTGHQNLIGEIKAATRYKLLAKTFLLAQQTSPRKALQTLSKQYDAGVSSAFLEKSVKLAVAASSKITQAPRYKGLASGLAASAALLCGYYFSPVRAALGAYLPSSPVDIVLDIVPAILCGALTTFVIRYTGASAIRTALGHLVNDEKRKKLMARAQGLGLWGYAGAFLLTLLLVEISVALGGYMPNWQGALKTMLGL